MNSIRTSLFSSFLIRRLICDQRTGIRHLYSPAFLSVDSYLQNREQTLKQFGLMKDNFFTRMTTQIESGDSSLIFTEDLKSMIHLSTAEELDLCVKMMKKFHKQNKELRFGLFVFGPVVMRLLYYLDQPELMLQLLKDQELDGFFHQIKSYVLAMDLLFKKGRYQDVLDIHDLLSEKQILDVKYPRDCFILACASCYKLNTPESLDHVINLVKNARSIGADILQRALYFVIHLALNQNKPDISMELLSSLNLRNNMIYNNSKIIILSRLERTQEALQLLKSKVEEDIPSQSLIRGDIFQATLDEVEKKVEASGDVELKHQYEQINRSLQEMGGVSSQSLDEHLCMQITPRIPPNRAGPGIRDLRRPIPRRERDVDLYDEADEVDYPSIQRRREPMRRQGLRRATAVEE